MAAKPGFKSQRQSSSAAPSPTPPTIGYTCQRSSIFPAFLGCHSESGRAWPRGVGPILSKLSHRPCNQGELPPSYLLGGSHSHPAGSKHDWLFNIPVKPVTIYRYVKWPCQRLAAKLAMQNNSQWPCSMCPIPQFRPARVRTSHIFNNFGHPEFWTPLQIPFWGTAGCTLLQIHWATPARAIIAYFGVENISPNFMC